MNHLSAVLPAVPRPAAADAVEPSDAVFKAMADPSRRLLLDSLLLDDGQSLGELAAQLPSMTRFGVMKHLRLLEAAGLVIARKVGREKLHYLNRLPIRLMHDRWLARYLEPGSAAG
jgi:DNA-binding transcriptional ArsR family regulator